MKKLLVLLLALSMVFTMAACGKKEEPAAQPGGETAQIANPIKEYDSLPEICEAAGVGMMPYGGTDERFSTINDETAQYNFTLNGFEYTYRATAYTYEDISGIYLANGPAFTNFHPGNDEPTTFVFDSEYKLARWFTQSQCQYVLSVKDDGKLSEDDFKAFVEEIQGDTGVMRGFAYYDALEGTYTDSVSQRAMMEVKSIGWEGIMCTVHWASSANEFDQWEMMVVEGEDGLLSYNDCLHQRFVLNDKGEETVETLGENGQGYFTFDENGNLAWSGAEDIDCQNCVFELMPQ